MKARFSLYFILLSMVATPTAQNLPPAFPRANVVKLLETDRFVVWDIVWPKGQPTPMHRHVHDQVGTYYAAGGRIITAPDGSSRTTATRIGALSTTRKGTTHIEEGSTDPPLRAVFIELKRETSTGAAIEPSGVPDAFPRGDSKPLLDDERVTIWDNTWTAGVPGARSRYTRETVLIWLAKGKLRFTPSSGGPTVVDVEPGQIRHYASGTTEADEALEGSPRAMVISFK